MNYSTTYEPDEFLQWKADTKKPPQVNRIGRYLEDLTNDEILTFNQDAGTLLNRFEYGHMIQIRTCECQVNDL